MSLGPVPPAGPQAATPAPRDGQGCASQSPDSRLPVGGRAQGRVRVCPALVPGLTGRRGLLEGREGGRQRVEGWSPAGLVHLLGTLGAALPLGTPMSQLQRSPQGP